MEGKTKVVLCGSVRNVSHIYNVYILFVVYTVVLVVLLWWLTFDNKNAECTGTDPIVITHNIPTSGASLSMYLQMFSFLPWNWNIWEYILAAREEPEEPYINWQPGRHRGWPRSSCNFPVARVTVSSFFHDGENRNGARSLFPPPLPSFLSCP